MRKRISACLLVCMIFLLTACSGTIPDTSTIAADKNGKITCTIAEDFEKDFYDSEELKGEIEAELAEYNQNFASDHIRMKKFRVKDGRAVLQLAFDGYEYYADYSGRTFFVGTVEDALKEGYSLEGIFYDGDGTDLFDSAAWAQYHVMILDEAVNAEVPGEILYASEAVSIEGKKLASVKEETTAYIIYQ